MTAVTRPGLTLASYGATDDCLGPVWQLLDLLPTRRGDWCRSNDRPGGPQ